MPLPTSHELQEMLECASPYPWQMEWGFIIPSDRERDRLLADLGGGYGGTSPRKEDTGLMLIAPQLAEEVIRLRNKLERIEGDCLDRTDRAKEVALRFSRSEADKEYWRGRADSYHAIYQKHLED